MKLQPMFGDGGWRAGNADLAKSDAAWQWQLRPPAFRRELIERDALVYQGGKLYATEKTRAVVLDIIKRRSLAALCGSRDSLSVDRVAA